MDSEISVELGSAVEAFLEFYFFPFFGQGGTVVPGDRLVSGLSVKLPGRPMLAATRFAGPDSSICIGVCMPACSAGVTESAACTSSELLF